MQEEHLTIALETIAKIQKNQEKLNILIDKRLRKLEEYSHRHV